MKGVHYQSSMSLSSSSNASNIKNTVTTPSSSSVKKPANPQYFEQVKRGEVDELKDILKKNLFEKDDKKKRELIKKVIAYMTLGIDVSKLFDQMCIVSQTNDIINKKMIYLYLTNYAEQNPNTALMAINTFIKDTKHKDGKIRGLALRSLCSLRFSGSFEYLMNSIQDGLQDLDPYVRKTAIMGCVKVYYMNPETIKNSDIIDQLYKMVKDPDYLVVQNAICALNEILADEGGAKAYRQMVIHLLNNLKNFSNWGQAIVLQFVAKYKPKNDDEMYDMMNLLDERLKQSCVSVVLATIKIFMSFTVNNPVVYKSIFKRVKTPLITLISTTETAGSFEISYTVLSHINLITSKGGACYFQDEFKQFYCKADEPTYIKFLKLGIICNLASELNIGDIMNELGEYVTDVDNELAKESIKTLGSIACKLQEMTTPIIKQLSNFITMHKEYITNNTLIAFRNILRKHPSVFKEIVECIPECVDYVTEPESKSALLWIFGEFSQQIPDAPYIIENFISDESQEPTIVKQTYLITCIKMFLRSPDEMKQQLGSLFKSILSNKDEDIDLKDRAAFFYRAMQNDIEGFKQTMLNKHWKCINKFSEEEEESNQKVCNEFNTLAIIYNKPSDKYTKPFAYFNMLRNKELIAEKISNDEKQEQEADVPTPVQKANPTAVVEDLIESEMEQGYMNQPQQRQQQVPSKQEQINLLDLDDNFCVPNLQDITINDLLVNFAFDSDDYEQAWSNLNEGAQFTRLLNANTQISEQRIEDLFKANRIYSAAQGEQDNMLKFYFYSKHNSSNEIVYLEVSIHLINKTLSLVAKCQNEEIAAFFSKYVEGFLKSNIILS